MIVDLSVVQLYQYEFITLVTCCGSVCFHVNQKSHLRWWKFAAKIYGLQKESKKFMHTEKYDKIYL